MLSLSAPAFETSWTLPRISLSSITAQTLSMPPGPRTLATCCPFQTRRMVIPFTALPAVLAPRLLSVRPSVAPCRQLLPPASIVLARQPGWLRPDGVLYALFGFVIP